MSYKRKLPNSRPRRIKRKHVRRILNLKKIPHEKKDLPHMAEMLNKQTKVRKRAARRYGTQPMENYFKSIIKNKHDKDNFEYFQKSLQTQQTNLDDFISQQKITTKIQDDVDMLNRFKNLQNYIDSEGKLSITNLAKFINDSNIGDYIKGNIKKMMDLEDKQKQKQAQVDELQNAIEESEKAINQLNHMVEIEKANTEEVTNTLTEEKRQQRANHVKKIQQMKQEQQELEESHLKMQEELTQSITELKQQQEQATIKKQEMKEKIKKVQDLYDDAEFKYLEKQEEANKLKDQIKENYKDVITYMKHQDRRVIDDFINASNNPKINFKKAKFIEQQMTSVDPTEIEQEEFSTKAKSYDELIMPSRLIDIHTKASKQYRDKMTDLYKNIKYNSKIDEAIKEPQEEFFKNATVFPGQLSRKELTQDEIKKLMSNELYKNNNKGEYDESKLKNLITQFANSNNITPLEKIFSATQYVENQKYNNKKQFTKDFNDIQSLFSQIYKDEPINIQDKALKINLEDRLQNISKQQETLKSDDSDEEDFKEQQDPSQEAQGKSQKKFIKYDKESIPRILIIGSPGSGKTTAALELIRNLQDDRTHSFIITQNFNEQKYINPPGIHNYYSNAMQKETQTMDPQDLLIKTLERAQLIKDKGGNTIVMLDDLPQLLKDKKVNHFLRTTRAMNCIFIVVCHDITDVYKSDRPMFSNLLLFSGQNTRLREISDMQQVPLKQLKDIYEKNVGVPGSFLLFSRGVATIIEKGFTGEILFQPTYLTFETIPQQNQTTSSFPKDGLSIREIDQQLKYVESFKGVIEVNATSTQRPSQSIVVTDIPSTYIFFVNNYDHPNNAHYTALGINDVDLCYYDSYGQPPCDQIKQLIENTKLPFKHMLKYKVNKIKQQSDSSSTCGQFAIEFVKKFSLGVPFRVITGYDDIKKNEQAMADEYKHFEKFSYI